MAGVSGTSEASGSGGAASSRKAGGYQAVGDSGDEEASGQKQPPVQAVDVPGHNELFNEDNVSDYSSFP